MSAENISAEYTRQVSAVKDGGEQLIRKIAEKLKAGWGWYIYLPPEARGSLIKTLSNALSQPKYSNNYDLRNLVAFSVNELLSTTQSSSHLNNTLERINNSLGAKSGKNEGIELISSIVSGTKYDHCVAQCTAQLAQATPLLGRPFLRNDEPDFFLAKFPLHHPAYRAS
jgi:hypothetical protein